MELSNILKTGILVTSLGLVGALALSPSQNSINYLANSEVENLGKIEIIKSEYENHIEREIIPYCNDLTGLFSFRGPYQDELNNLCGRYLIH